MATYKAAVVYNRHFFMVDSANHLSAKTGLTPTVNISKAGAAFGAAAGAVSEIGNGWYRVALTTADTSTTGDLMFHITSAGADDTDFADQIVSYDPFDAAALGLSRIDAAITSRMATFTLPANFATLVIDANGRVDLSKWIGVAPAAVTTNGYVQTALQRWKTDDAAGTPNALITNRVDSNVGVNSDKTGYSLTQTFPTNFSALAITAGGAVTVGTNSDKTGYALTAGEHTSITADVWDSARSGHTTAGSFGQGVASVQGNVTGSVASLTTNNDKTGYALSTAGVQAVWDEATSALTTVGSIGKRLADDIDATISSRSTFAGGAVASVTGNVGGNVVGSIGSVAAGGIANTSFAIGAIDAAALASSGENAIADALLDRDMSTGTDSGSPSVRTVRQALRVLRNKASIAAGTLTVTKEDDATSSWTATVTTSAGNPISTIDPA